MVHQRELLACKRYGVVKPVRLLAQRYVLLNHRRADSRREARDQHGVERMVAHAARNAENARQVRDDGKVVFVFRGGVERDAVQERRVFRSRDFDCLLDVAELRHAARHDDLDFFRFPEFRERFEQGNVVQLGRGDFHRVWLYLHELAEAPHPERRAHELGAERVREFEALSEEFLSDLKFPEPVEQPYPSRRQVHVSRLRVENFLRVYPLEFNPVGSRADSRLYKFFRLRYVSAVRSSYFRYYFHDLIFGNKSRRMNGVHTFICPPPGSPSSGCALSRRQSRLPRGRGGESPSG